LSLTSLVFDQIVSLIAVETSAFITARCTEGSAVQLWPSVTPVLQRLLKHLSTSLASNYILQQLELVRYFGSPCRYIDLSLLAMYQDIEKVID